MRKSLTSDNRNLAETHILLNSQLDMFPEEIRCIRSNVPVSHRSCLSKLAPYIDKDNLLRLSTRIVEAPGVEEGIKSPVLLHGKHPAVRLLVKHFHQKSAHANTERVVNELRQRYWIVGLRNVIKTVIHSCQFCKIRCTQRFNPPMGNLP